MRWRWAPGSFFAADFGDEHGWVELLSQVSAKERREPGARAYDDASIPSRGGRMRAAVLGMCLVMAVTVFAQQPASSASSSGKAVLEAYASAWNRHDAAAFDKILAPDAVHEDIALAVYAQ